jgi:ferredoxin-NADP reductase
MVAEVTNLPMKDAPEYGDAAFEVRIEAVGTEADDVISLTLVDPDGGLLPPWQPGAHIDVCLAGGLVRQYSLCGENGENYWRICILDEPDGRGGSRQIHRECKPGDLLTVRGPRNHFPLVSAPSYLFIAGGIGVTPLLPMLATAISSGADWRFLYGGRSRTSMAFVDRLTALGERVAVRPQDAFGLLDLSEAISAVSADTMVYCCGPEPLIAAVEATCDQLGRSKPRVERFAAGPMDDVEQSSFTVVIESTGQELEVGVDDAILEVLEANGVAVDSSCREGICGTCETPVRSGSVVHRDYVLTDDEKLAGDCMMVCVSRAASSRLVLGL